MVFKGCEQVWTERERMFPQILSCNECDQNKFCSDTLWKHAEASEQSGWVILDDYETKKVSHSEWLDHQRKHRMNRKLLEKAAHRSDGEPVTRSAEASLQVRWRLHSVFLWCFLLLNADKRVRCNRCYHTLIRSGTFTQLMFFNVILSHIWLSWLIFFVIKPL